MVLTVEEVRMAEGSADRRVQRALRMRRATVSFNEQCTCDREIQRYLNRKGSLAWKFNCFVIHQPWTFAQVVEEFQRIIKESHLFMSC